MTINSALLAVPTSTLSDADLPAIPHSSLILATKPGLPNGQETYNISGTSEHRANVFVTNTFGIVQPTNKGQIITNAALARHRRKIMITLANTNLQTDSANATFAEFLPVKVGLTVDVQRNELTVATAAQILDQISALYCMLVQTTTAGVPDTVILERLLSGGRLKA